MFFKGSCNWQQLFQAMARSRGSRRRLHKEQTSAWRLPLPL